MTTRPALALYATLLLTGPPALADNHPTSVAEAAEALAAPAQARARAVAEAHGFNNWSDVTELRFTFNVTLPGTEVTRAWRWRPQDRSATLDPGTDAAQAIDLGNVTNATEDAHAKFVNDMYWLLFPFQLIWSEPDLELETGVATPDGLDAGETVDRLIVRYTGGDGYTPGDRYDLYLAPGGTRIHGWSFFKEGAAGEVSGTGMMSNWAAPVEHGGLQIIERFEGAGGPFELTFTDVEVE